VSPHSLFLFLFKQYREQAYNVIIRYKDATKQLADFKLQSMVASRKNAVTGYYKLSIFLLAINGQLHSYFQLSL
jgi:hypothetical protein